MEADGLDHRMALELNRCLFNNNSALSSGGALALTGDEADPDASSCTLAHCTFRGNGGRMRGGAMYASNCRFAATDCTFANNSLLGASLVTAAAGSALYYGGSSAYPASTIIATNFTANTPNPTLRTEATLEWTCAGGHYMPRTGAVNDDFDGCKPCLGGYFGSSSKATEPSCTSGSDTGDSPAGLCPQGYFCPAGSAAPQPCGDGTHLPSTGASSATSCTACAPGSYSALPGNGNESCTPCPRGTFSELLRSASCEPCQLGGYCADVGQASALMAWTACPAGSLGNATGLISALECVLCPAGSFCLEGRRGVPPEPRSCPQGHFCASGASEPAPCPAGTFQDEADATACKACSIASWCGEGSSAPTACPAGTVGEREGLKSVVECSICPMGFWCSAGAAIPCGANTYNDALNATNEGACTACPPNSRSPSNATSVAACKCTAEYYDRRSATEQVECTACPVGSSCARDGATLEELPLLEGYYRISAASADPRACPAYGGVPGKARCLAAGRAGEGTCAANLTGVYCTAAGLKSGRWRQHPDPALWPAEGLGLT